MRHILYMIWCATLLAGLAYSHYAGGLLPAGDAERGVPPSMRNNPGAYRAHYFWGGK